MSYQVFARKYRPTTFADVLGQDHVVRTLRNAIEQDRIAQAYLFSGPRGTGKTSTARILAKALNCPGGPMIEFDPNDPVCIEIAEGRSLDVLEIDGASNNSVDQIRDLRDTVKFAPTSGKYKIYYIDEVHMLSTAAFNALLKTLEEPPPHVKFIFATTEPNKVLPTILSRCQRFDLRPISEPIIAKHLLHIAHNENVTLEPEAAQAVAKGADGGMRDAQSMLDQLVAFCGNTITEDNVIEIFGFSSQETIAKLAESLLNRNTAAALELIHTEHQGGRDLGSLLGELIQFFRNLLLVTVSPANSLPDLLPETRQRLTAMVNRTTTDRLLEATDSLADYQNKMRWSADKQLHFELAAIKTIQIFEESSIGDVIRILRNVANGAPVPPAPLPVAQPPAAQPEPQPVTKQTPAPERTPTPQTDPAPVDPPAAVSPPIDEPTQSVQEEPPPTEMPAVADPPTSSPVEQPADTTPQQPAVPENDTFDLDLTGDLMAELEKPTIQDPVAQSQQTPAAEDAAPDVEPVPEMTTNDEVLAEILRRLDARSEGMVVAAFEGSEVTAFGPDGVTVSFPKEVEFEVDTVVRPSVALPQVIRELNLGETLTIELSDDLHAPEVDLSTPDLSEFITERPDSSPAPADDAPADNTPQVPTGGGDGNDPPLIAQIPGFYDDPAIAELAEEFGLRVVKNNN